jgi:hypothetical protein
MHGVAARRVDIVGEGVVSHADPRITGGTETGSATGELLEGWCSVVRQG